MAKHNQHAAHNHDSKDLEYDLTSQKRASLNQTNDHLDVQVYVQIRVTRQSLQTQSSRHSQTRVILNQISTKAEQAVIADHFEIRLISLAVIVFVEWQANNFITMTPASWNVLFQEEPNKKMMFAKYQRSSSILHLQKEDDKSKKTL